MTTNDAEIAQKRGIATPQVAYLISQLVPPATAQKIAEWVADKNFRVAGLHELAFDAIKNMDRDTEAKLADDVYSTYCNARGLTRVYVPENLTRAVDMIAVKFHFADGKAMSERSEALFQDVQSGLAARPWLDNYIMRQQIEDQGRRSLSHFTNTWWKEWQETWTDGKRAFYQKCQNDHIIKSSRTYTYEELFEAIQTLLSSCPERNYTYNHVAKRLQIAEPPTPGAMAQRMKVKDILERLSNPKQNIYEDVIKYVTRPTKGKKAATVYKWAPLRRKLDRTPSRRTVIIQEAVLAFIRKHSDSGKRAIRDAMRTAFGQIANADVDTALDSLIMRQEIEDPKQAQRGSHGKFFYQATPEVPDRPFDTNDMFGVKNGDW